MWYISIARRMNNGLNQWLRPPHVLLSHPCGLRVKNPPRQSTEHGRHLNSVSDSIHLRYKTVRLLPCNHGCRSGSERICKWGNGFMCKLGNEIMCKIGNESICKIRNDFVCKLGNENMCKIGNEFIIS